MCVLWQGSALRANGKSDAVYECTDGGWPVGDGHLSRDAALEAYLGPIRVLTVEYLNEQIRSLSEEMEERFERLEVILHRLVHDGKGSGA